MNPVCPKCQQEVLESYYFCPKCGKQLKDKPLSTSILKQAGIYLFAFFFPPFGLVPAYKYLKQNSEQTRIIGSIAILITVISLILTIWASAKFIETLNTTLNQQLPRELNLYR